MHHFARGIEDFSMIHDSFGTHATNCDKFVNVIRQTFHDLYENNDPLQDLFTTYESLGAPHPPEKGDLDLSLVLRSLYAFS